jgi:aspartate-semialdehyde dehydrogenase
MVISAHTNRVAVVDGHTMTVSVQIEAKARIGDLRDAFTTFTARPQELKLPTAPIPPILLREEPDRPQPRLDSDLGGGMTVSVGRLRPCPVMSYRFVALGHNTVRGAAGASILNAELMHAELQCLS